MTSLGCDLGHHFQSRLDHVKIQEISPLLHGIQRGHPSGVFMRWPSNFSLSFANERLRDPAAASFPMRQEDPMRRVACRSCAHAKEHYEAPAIGARRKKR